MATEIHAFSPEEIMAYLDGELSSDRSLAALEHLRDCRDCQILSDGLKRLSHSMVAWQVEASAAVAPVQIEEKPSRKLLPFYKRPWLLAAPVALLALVLVVWNRDFQPRPAPAGENIAASDAVQPPALPPAAPLPMAERKASAPVNGRQFVAVQSLAAGPAPQTLLVRTAQLSITSQSFDQIRREVERLMAVHGGYIAAMQLNMQTGAGRSLAASLRVPADQLDALLVQLKQLGRVHSESQSGDDVTQQSVDLDARLSNLKATELRLQQILQNRTGKLSDVLQVEEAVDRTRGEIEQAEAERKSLSNRISYAAVEFAVEEEFKASLGGHDGSVWTRLRNAAVAGIHNLVHVVMAVLIFLLSVGPAVLLVAAAGALPAFWFWRRLKSRRWNVL